MSKFVEKITAVEEQIALIQSKIAPLTSKIDGLDGKIQNFSKLLAEITEDIVVVRQEIDSTQQSFDSIQAILTEAKTEGEQLTVGQDENKQLHESLMTMFGEAFQAASRFFDTAQKFGIVDKEKVSEFLISNQSATKPETVIQSSVVGTGSHKRKKNVEILKQLNIKRITLPPIIKAETSEITAKIPEPLVPAPVFTDEPVFDGLPNVESVPEIAKLSPSNLLTPDAMFEEVPPINNDEAATDIAIEQFAETDPLNLPPLTTPSSDPIDVLSVDEEKELEDLLTGLSKPITT